MMDIKVTKDKNIFYLYQQLDIVPSYHCMQCPGKLMNQTDENFNKTLFLGTILARLAQIWVSKKFFVDFTSPSS